MTDQYPRMLYKSGGTENCHGMDCETRVVADEAEALEAAQDGWALSPSEAHGGEAPPAPLPEPEEVGPEIEAMRDEIAGLKQELEDERAISKQLDADLTAAKDGGDLQAKLDEAVAAHARVTDALEVSKARVAELEKAAADNDELLKQAEAERDAAIAKAASKESGGTKTGDKK